MSNQKNRTFYLVKNTGIEFSLSENSSINSNDANKCSKKDLLEWKGEKTNDIDLLDNKLLDTSVFNNLITEIIKKLLLDKLDQRFDSNNINIPSIIFPDSLNYLVDLSNSPICKTFLSELQNFINNFVKDNEFKNFIQVKDNSIEWKNLIDGIFNIYKNIAEENWNNEKPPFNYSNGKNKQKMVKLGKARIFQEMANSLEQPTRIFNEVIEIPDKIIRDKYRDIYNLNSTEFEKLFELNQDQKSILNLSEIAVIKYYMDHSKNGSYKNYKLNNFKKNQERFGVYGNYSKGVYNSRDYNSEDNKHNKCIDQMLDKVKLFEDNILSNIIKKYYPNWFNKRESVKYPLNVKKLFKVFAMMALNYNVTTDYHNDKNDDGLSVVVPVGDWEGGWLVLPSIKTIVKLSKGNILFLKADLLIHGNTPAIET
ncbi:15331_t:CDS:2 [Dentiscutata heterogama]|uniref:15331_t:CDS:1 n=1 Tax=Dentiscutata heterogama TaxID=1316150 RepID=A0ACA9K277_9GLOM|nr:15331_t:CDS:2 [Dentiscutata heterogama]